MSAVGPAIVQYWDSEEIPADVAALVASFEERRRGLPHLVFSEREAAELIAARLGEREARAFAACAVPAMQADYFRYCALLALGGIYADADFRCLAPPRPLLEDTVGGTLFGRAELPPRWRTPAFEWRERVGPYRVVANSLLAFPSPRHPLLRLAVDLATANIEAKVEEDVALVTGPAVFTSLYLVRELGSLDAFVEYAAGGVLERSSQLLRETVGSQERVFAAFDGVRIRPMSEAYELVAEGGEELSYKRTDEHWLNVTTSIYR